MLEYVGLMALFICVIMVHLHRLGRIMNPPSLFTLSFLLALSGGLVAMAVGDWLDVRVVGTYDPRDLLYIYGLAVLSFTVPWHLIPCGQLSVETSVSKWSLSTGPPVPMASDLPASGSRPT